MYCTPADFGNKGGFSRRRGDAIHDPEPRAVRVLQAEGA
jgi:hypothetical protein